MKTPQFLRQIISFMALNDPFNYMFLVRAATSMTTSISTMGVSVQGNRYNLMYNPNFVKEMTDPELTFVLRHEVMHIVLHHCTSRQVRDKRKHALANVAMDLAINSLIREDQYCSAPTYKKDCEGTDYEGRPMKIKAGDRMGMFPDIFGFDRGLSYEQYMMLLEEKYPDKDWNEEPEKCPFCQEQERKEQEKQDQGEGEPGDGQPGDGEGQGEGEPGDGQPGDGEGQGEGEPGDGQGSGQGSGQGCGGEPGDGQGCGGSGEPSQCTCQGCGGSGEQGKENRNLPQVPRMDEHREFHESPALQSQIKQQIKQIRANEKMWGSVPGDVQEAIKAAQRSEITWEQKLRRKYGKFPLPKREATLKRPDKKRGYPNPGITMNSFVNSVFVFMDTSASVNDKELSKFLAETRTLAGHMPVKLQFFDTQLAGKPIDMSGRKRKLKEFKVQGRGGTCFQGPIQKAIESKTKQIVIFSDGYAPEPDYGDYRGDILWVITKNGSQEVEGWRGDSLYLKSSYSDY